MRARLLILSCVTGLVGSASAAEPLWQIAAHDRQSVQQELLALASTQLPPGLHLDAARARMSLSAMLPGPRGFDVRPIVAAGSTPPLSFELRPTGSPSAPPVRATLAAPLLREVWITARRVHKGSRLSAADLQLQRRPLRSVPKLAVPLGFEVPVDAVALRELPAGEALRSVDLGQPWDVQAGDSVRVSVVRRSINISAPAIAISDARAGDRIDVRLQQHRTLLSARVTGPGTAQLLEAAP